MDILSACVGGAIGIVGCVVSQLLRERQGRRERRLAFCRERVAAYGRLYAAAHGPMGRSIEAGSLRGLIADIADAFTADAHLLTAQDRLAVSKALRPLLTHATSRASGQDDAGRMAARDDEVSESVIALLETIHMAHAREASRYAREMGMDAEEWTGVADGKGR